MRSALRVTRAVVALTGAAALMAFAFTAPPAAAEDQEVAAGTPTANVFLPAAVTVDVGDTVTWRWGGGFGHTVTATSGNWGKDSPVGPPAATLTTTRLFTKAGTYTYVCKTHGPTMSGSVVVRAAATPKPTVKPPTPRPSSPRPTATATATAQPSASVSPTPSASPSSGSATPVLPGVSTSPPPSRRSGVPPLPSISLRPGETPYLGAGGLTAPPATGRQKGLPVMLALLLIGGVGSAELRALLASAPPR